MKTHKNRKKSITNINNTLEIIGQRLKSQELTESSQDNLWKHRKSSAMLRNHLKLIRELTELHDHI